MWDRQLDLFQHKKTVQRFGRQPQHLRHLPPLRSWREHPDVGLVGPAAFRPQPETVHRPIKTLLIDNYDSYTFNLFQAVAQVNGHSPVVIRNDELMWREVARKLARKDFDNVIISPGPGSPANARDLGVCKAVLEEAEDVPVLGVCLGMQALAHVHGAKVQRAAEPVHGRLSHISHNGHPLFHDIPSGHDSDFLVVRYHSLAVDPDSLPSCLEPIAWTCGNNQPVNLSNEEYRCEGDSDAQSNDRIVMGLAHKQRPHWGVQFHPESVGTRYGTQLLTNFRDKTAAHWDKDRGQGPGFKRRRLSNKEDEPQRNVQQATEDSLHVDWDVIEGCLPTLGGSEGLFKRLFIAEDQNTFWLDSASQHGQRFSYMGGKGGALWQRLTFKLAPPGEDSQGPKAGTLHIEDYEGSNSTTQTHLLDYLEQRLQEQHCKVDQRLPFDFTGGYVGYLGYEMKAECGMPGVHQSPDADAAFFFVDRLLVVDHHLGNVNIVALSKSGNKLQSEQSQAWIARTKDAISRSGCCASPTDYSGANRPAQKQPPPSERSSERSFGDEERILGREDWMARRSQIGYVSDIEKCLEALHSGESYELCYTTKLKYLGSVDAMLLYLALRASNPAMHAAWLNFGPDIPEICCSSPERFLKGDRDGWVEARPIKGTARRYADPILDQQSKSALLSSPKARAENLMIVDLLRNDLGRVCEVGSVHVPGLMEVETYATVHNLVSTVRGKLKAGASVIHCLRAAFPGGSMTGAPKFRSLQILDRLENGARGVYSGSLGYIGLNGTFDLNIVIRTAIVGHDSVQIGAGGAIVLQSDPEAEYEEMRLKASALIRALDQCRTETSSHIGQQRPTGSCMAKTGLHQSVIAT